MKIIIIIAVVFVSVFSLACSSRKPAEQAKDVVEVLDQKKLNRFTVYTLQPIDGGKDNPMERIMLRNRLMTFVCTGPQNIPSDQVDYHSKLIQQVDSGVKDFRLVYSDNGPAGIECTVNTGDLDDKSIVYTTFLPVSASE
ncbi:MAG TPA: hypothetical protein VHQ20_01790 [Patescibacteria group bacterium]|jgi:hypothetical protein|nr:hypothetical protein [Patescibacteria group bacterium]